MGKIQDKSFGYELIKRLVRFLFPKFFRQIEVRGLENLPTDRPLIFAGNHQNGVMDPVAIILFQSEPIVYMARADIFNSWLNRVLLRFIKVTPVYRIRDGFENLSKNDKQIREAIDVLLDGKRLGVMPEGNHGEQHKLRPLVKGLFRIGFQAEIQLQGKQHVQIIPVGIDYSFYQHAGSDLVLIYGKPIEVQDFLPIYLENPAVGLNTLRSALAEALSSVMLDIRSDDYDRTYRLCCYGVTAYLDFLMEKNERTDAETMAGLRYDARVALAKLFDRMEKDHPKNLRELDKRTFRLNQLPGSPAETQEWMEYLSNPVNKLAVGVIGLICLPGFILNAASLALNQLIVRNVEDKQMHATFVFTLGVAFNFIVYLIATFILGQLLETTILQKAALFVILGTLGIVSEKARQYLRVPFRMLRYAFGKRKSFVQACQSDYEELKSMIGNLVRKESL